MRPMTKKAGGQVLGYGGSAGIYLIVTRVAGRAGVELDADEAAVLVGALIWVVHRLPWVWAKGLRPIAAALHRRLLRWLGG